MYDADELRMVTEHDPLVNQTSSSSKSPSPDGVKSVQDVLDDGSFNMANMLYLIALGFIGIADSMQACYVAIVLPVLTCQWYLTAAEQAVVTSLNFFGTGVGAVLVGPLSDRYGRKPTAMATSLGLFVSMVITSGATNLFFFLTFSVISGFCCGGSLSIAYTYWAEVSSLKHRATGVMVITMFWNTGLLSSNGFAYLVLNRIGWSTYTIMMAVPAFIPVVLLGFLPESPKFLNGKQKTEECLTSLRRITTISAYDLDDITIAKEPTSNTEVSSGKLGILKSFATICGEEHRGDTLRIVSVYSGLQIIFKSFLFVLTAMLTTNYCQMKTGLKSLNIPGTETTDAADNQTNTNSYSDHCETLSNGDLVNAMMLSTVLYASTLVGIAFCKWFGELKSMKIFSLACLVCELIVLICLPTFLMFVVTGALVFSISGISLVFYMILPQLYPTIARNSGFGLVDGVGKLVASVAIFFVTALLNYSLRLCIGFLILITVLINIQVFFTRLSVRLETPDVDRSRSKGQSAAHSQ